ncbi:MAG: GSCFA domain-containing protein [Prevotella sp.]|nr:GSCFA domain-containing protein [Prevotella sp.]
MEFRTIVEIPHASFEIMPCEEVLLVGSCFADGIGRKFNDNGFPAIVNPFGTMYNPASILHTFERLLCSESSEKTLQAIPRIVFLTLGTNHVYRLKETGEIVDNCEKRPASLFQEEELTVCECTNYLRKTVELLKSNNPEVQTILTVSPIRYRKYGYHESQLSKATLLLATSEASMTSTTSNTSYFPAYELLMDELRDYRFYAADMLHPSGQAVDYIWERLNEWCFSREAKSFMEEWHPIRQALSHRPFHPESEEYQRFKAQTQARLQALQEKYPNFKSTIYDTFK